MLKLHWRHILLILFLIISAPIIYLLSLQTILPIEQNEVTSTGTCDSLELEKDEKSKTATIICLKSGLKTKAIVLNDMNIDHYHGYEINHNNLYIIRSGDYDANSYDMWSDELWVYKTNLESIKLFSDKGLDFRVSDDGNQIAIISTEYLNLLNSTGKILHTFTKDELIIDSKISPMFNFNIWVNDDLWIDNSLGPSINSLVKINTKTFEMEKYDLSNVLTGADSSLSRYSPKIAFSNFPPLFDTESADTYSASGSKVNLIVYDLNSRSKTMVATSITKRFSPKWLNASTLEYNNPNEEGRITKEIK